jgi:hypothetical protein
LGCCTARSRRLTWRRRLLRRTMVERKTVRRRRVQDRGRPAVGQLQVS